MVEVEIGDLINDRETWDPKSEGDGEFSYVDLGSVDKDRKEIATVERLPCAAAPSRARQLVQQGDVLVATVRPNLNGVARVSEAYDGMTASTGFTVLRPKADALDSGFLFHWVRTPIFIDRMVAVATGASYPAVSDTKVKASKIPLPPLPEQRRIAAILDAADALRTKRRESLEQLEQLIPSVFLEMFGDPVANPRGWETLPLPDCYATPETGTKCGPFGSALKKAELVDEGVPVWNMDNIGPLGRMALPFRMWVTPEKFEELGAYAVEDGDVVVSRAGTVGKMCVARTGGQPSIISTNLIRVRFGPTLHPEYFVVLMTFFGPRIGRLRTGADGAFTHMNTKVLDSLEIPVPPATEQRRFVEFLLAAGVQRMRLINHLAELDTLFASLQSRAFRGEL